MRSPSNSVIVTPYTTDASSAGFDDEVVERELTGVGHRGEPLDPATRSEGLGLERADLYVDERTGSILDLDREFDDGEDRTGQERSNARREQLVDDAAVASQACLNAAQDRVEVAGCRRRHPQFSRTIGNRTLTVRVGSGFGIIRCGG